MITTWLIAIVIALILLKAALREQNSTRNFAWNSHEVDMTTTWKYLLAIAALAFVLVAIILAK